MGTPFRNNRNILLADAKIHEKNKGEDVRVKNCLRYQVGLIEKIDAACLLQRSARRFRIAR